MSAKKVILSLALVVTVLTSCLTQVHGVQGRDLKSSEDIYWEDMPDMPVARSDLSATVVTVGGMDKIFLFGGCSKDQKEYCEEVTKRCDVFDPVTKQWNDGITCKELPRARYRHAAVSVRNKIYLIGGTDATEKEIKVIDVYDPSTNTWAEFGTWEEATSDLAAFARGDDIYIVGGYDQPDYTAQSAIWKFSTSKTGSFKNNLAKVGNMKHARGDIFAAASEDYAYVTGGWSHVDSFDSPLETVERWSFATNEWERIANMTHARGDKALMHINGKIYAIGGEQKNDEKKPKPIKDVEVYDESTDTWTVESEIVDETFRFVAAAHEPTESIYIFGGQNYYDKAW